MKTIKTGLAALMLMASVQGVYANDLIGILIGGTAGGLLGNQIGPQNSTEKTVATVAGALIGAQVGQNLSGRATQTTMSAPSQVQPSVYHVPAHRPKEHSRQWSDYQPGKHEMHRPVKYVTVYETPGDDASWENKIALLKELGELRKAGVLTGAEFEAEKAKILSGA